MSEIPYHDDPVESGALEDETSGPAETPPSSDDPAESGALEDEDSDTG